MTEVLLTVYCLMHARLARRDERGLSQSTENAILLAGAVAVAGTIVGIVTAYINGKLGPLQGH